MVQNSPQGAVTTLIGANQQIEQAYLLRIGPGQPVGTTTYRCSQRTSDGAALEFGIPIDLIVDAPIAYR